MNTRILKVLSQSEAITVQKQDGSTINKSTIVLQELGGKYEDSYACTLLGNAALCKWCAGDLVVVTLRFQHREVASHSTGSGQAGTGQLRMYQDVTVQTIDKLNR